MEIMIKEVNLWFLLVTEIRYLHLNISNFEIQ